MLICVTSAESSKTTTCTLRRTARHPYMQEMHHEITLGLLDIDWMKLYAWPSLTTAINPMEHDNWYQAVSTEVKLAVIGCNIGCSVSWHTKYRVSCYMYTPPSITVLWYMHNMWFPIYYFKKKGLFLLLLLLNTVRNTDAYCIKFTMHCLSNRTYIHLLIMPVVVPNAPTNPHVYIGVSSSFFGKQSKCYSNLRWFYIFENRDWT